MDEIYSMTTTHRPTHLRIDTSIDPQGMLTMTTDDVRELSPCHSAPLMTTTVDEGIDALVSESRTLLRSGRTRPTRGNWMIRRPSIRPRRSYYSYPYYNDEEENHRTRTEFRRIPLQSLGQSAILSNMSRRRGNRISRQRLGQSSIVEHSLQIIQSDDHHHREDPISLSNVKKRPWLFLQSLPIKCDPDDVEMTMRLMDKYYHASFYGFVRNEEHALCISRHLRPLAHKYSIDRLIHGIIWILEGWSFESYGLFLRHLTHGWNLEKKARFFRKFMNRTAFSMDDQIDLIHLLMTHETTGSVAVFLSIYTEYWSHQDIIHWICLWDHQSGWNYNQFCCFVEQFVELKSEDDPMNFMSFPNPFEELKATLLATRLPHIYLPLAIDGFFPSGMMMHYPMELRSSELLHTSSFRAEDNKENQPYDLIYPPRFGTCSSR